MPNPAEGYESYMVPALFGPCAANLIQAADLRLGERVLDVGCGTGIVARQIASQLEPNRPVMGLDISPNMLAVARATAAREGLAIEWRERECGRDALSSKQLRPCAVPVRADVLCRQAAALAEMRRVVTSNGRVLVTIWQGLDRHPFYQTLHNVIQQRVGISALQDIFALDSTDEVRALALSAGFQLIEIEPLSLTARFPNPDAFSAGEIEVDTAAIPSMQHLDARARQAIVSAITADMQSPLGEVTYDNHW